MKIGKESIGQAGTPLWHQQQQQPEEPKRQSHNQDQQRRQFALNDFENQSPDSALKYQSFKNQRLDVQVDSAMRNIGLNVLNSSLKAQQGKLRSISQQTIPLAQQYSSIKISNNVTGGGGNSSLKKDHRTSQFDLSYTDIEIQRLSQEKSVRYCEHAGNAR